MNKCIGAVFLFLFILVFFSSNVQCDHVVNRVYLPQIRENPTILLIGTFYPVDKRPKVDIITVKILNKTMLFKIDKVRNISGTKHGYSIINQLFPPVLKLTGPDKIISTLLKKDIFGKVYSLRGTIYASDNLLHLDMVKQGNVFDDINGRKK